MSEEKKMNRRELLGTLAGTGVIAGMSLMTTGQLMANDKNGKTDGTPAQFFPKNGPDENPQKNDIEKYPNCPYCGMSRSQFSHTRHLIHYDDNMIDPTCSIHCASIGLSINIDRGAKEIYAGDFGAEGEKKPLINVNDATYLVGSNLKGTMTMKSKLAFASKEKAEAAKAANGGETGNFDFALTEAYLSMAKDSAMIRKRRAERKNKMQKSQHEGMHRNH